MFSNIQLKHSLSDFKVRYNTAGTHEKKYNKSFHLFYQAVKGSLVVFLFTGNSASVPFRPLLSREREGMSCVWAVVTAHSEVSLPLLVTGQGYMNPLPLPNKMLCYKRDRVTKIACVHILGFPLETV